MTATTPMDALFILPPGGFSAGFAEHVGSAFLRTILLQQGVVARQYLPERNPGLPEFARFLGEHRPVLIGFTAYETNLRICRAMVRVVREALPESVVAVGGPNATFSPDETLDELGADLCVRGAGESSIGSIAAAILGTPSAYAHLVDVLGAVSNLAIRTSDGVHHTRLGDLSSIPGGAFRCLDDLPSPYQAGVIASPDIGLLTARGCNQACTYCSFAAASGWRVRYHGVERVLDDLAALSALAERQGWRGVVPIHDDTFTLAPQRARAICEGILRRGVRLRLGCETRADRVDRELLRLMRRAGFTTVAFGLESAVPRVLRAVGKVQDPATPDDPEFERERAFLASYRVAVAAARDVGLTPVVSVIGGLPGESAGDFRATLSFVKALRVPMYAHNVLSVLPGTPLYRDRHRFGIEAFRDGAGFWRTTHGYDVDDVAPLPHASRRRVVWEEAGQIADAVCGRPRYARAGEDVAWSVILHSREPSPRLATWLRQVLAVAGVIVVVTERGRAAQHRLDRWLRSLDRHGVPWSSVALVQRPDAAPGRTWVVRAMYAEHRFRTVRSWRDKRIEADPYGRARAPFWFSSDDAPPAARDIDLAPVPQIVDGCRWWSAHRRCRRPRVLHVWADGRVTACWRGPTLGRVGDPYAVIAAAGAALDGVASDRCPLGGASIPARATSAAAQSAEIASRAAWLIGAPAGAV